MGVERFSRHSHESWRDQWQRLQRWHGRLKSLEQKHLIHHGSDWTYAFLPEFMENEIDHAYAFVMHCYHLKDWLKASASRGETWGGRVEAHVSGSPGLSACADICNATKHFQLDSSPKSRQGGPRADANWTTLRSYSPATSRGQATPLVHVSGRTLSLLSLADLCMREWQEFLISEKLDVTNPV